MRSCLPPGPVIGLGELHRIDLRTEEDVRKFENKELPDAYDSLQHIVLGNQVETVSLPEPLKGRIISKGPAMRYWLGRCIQKITHGTLRNHPVFKAIGRPLDESDLQFLLPLGVNQKLLSGDYSAATDNLHPFFSELACRVIAQEIGMPSDMEQLFVDGLVNATIGGEKQSWGQLMGSPYSFPILCLINASINAYFLEIDRGVTLSLRDCPMLVNGDDVLLTCEESNYVLWKDMLGTVGLEFSVGKNYLSRDFAIINSTFYERRDTLFGQDLCERPYVNLGLMHPQAGIFRVQCDVRSDSKMSDYD
jgi:hypothetical protein